MSGLLEVQKQQILTFSFSLMEKKTYVGIDKKKNWFWFPQYTIRA